ncbi:MAG TPA: thioredoxin family protein [Bacteroidota bacterium]|nr:thioredoxin family protein [Bacteroidota bacterium]
MKEFFSSRRPHNGMTFEEYMAAFRQHVAERESRTPNDPKRQRSDYYVLNLRRSERLIRTFEPLPRTREVVKRIGTPQLWMVLSEFSCGDSAQCIPVIARIAEVNPRINLRILFRDQNDDIMDAYLTNGTRSIPKLVAYAEGGRELFLWGPRPEPARLIFEEGRRSGLPKEDAIGRVQLFYGRDGGRSVEQEFVELLSRD